MNKYLKEFLHRGLIFGGFGPIILGIIYVIVSNTEKSFSLQANEILIGIISVYLLAFIQAGASVFNQIEHWSIPKSVFFHFLTIYLGYTSCYIINTWIPFKAEIILLFTIIFIIVYVIIWLSVYFIIKLCAKKLNNKLN